MKKIILFNIEITLMDAEFEAAFFIKNLAYYRRLVTYPEYDFCLKEFKACAHNFEILVKQWYMDNYFLGNGTFDEIILESLFIFYPN